MYPMTRSSKTLCDYLLSFVVALVIACIVRADEPQLTVRNRMPQFTVSNRMPQFEVKNCCDPFAVESKSKSSAKPVSVVETTRAPVGHTHTCTTCGRSWDHKEASSHTCPYCGGSPPITGYSRDRMGNLIVHYAVDRVPRSVTVRRTTAAPVQVPVSQPLQRSSSVSYLNCGPSG